MKTQILAAVLGLTLVGAVPSTTFAAQARDTAPTLRQDPPKDGGHGRRKQRRQRRQQRRGGQKRARRGEHKPAAGN